MEGTQDKFSSLMRKGKLEMPFADFEDNTMRRIQAELKYKVSIRRNFRISFIFFVLGTGFGLIINSILSNADEFILGLAPETVLMAFQLIFVLVVLTQSENIYRLFLKLKE
ncbi:hypothetical protein [Daejeonella sp.]|uniref:hypothetical protein n=1 Tax=Daejeonella sp. TaxID=2805397 RepID=UPI0030BB5B79